MVWSMGFDDGFKVTIGMRELDGDLRKVEYVDATPDWPGVGGGFEPGDLELGRAIKPDHLPTRVQWDGPKRSGVPETLRGRQMMLVNDRFKDVIERFEPGIHQFFPLDLVWKDKTLAQKMHMFNICSRLSTTDRSLSTAEMSRGGMLEPSSGSIIFNLTQIGSHHIWIDKHMYAGVYVSDALHDALIEAKITGLAFSRRASTGDQQ